MEWQIPFFSNKDCFNLVTFIIQYRKFKEPKLMLEFLHYKALCIFGILHSWTLKRICSARGGRERKDSLPAFRRWVCLHYFLCATTVALLNPLWPLSIVHGSHVPCIPLYPVHLHREPAVCLSCPMGMQMQMIVTPALDHHLQSFPSVLIAHQRAGTRMRISYNQRMV